MPKTQESAAWIPPGPSEGEPEACLCLGSWCCSSCSCWLASGRLAPVSIFTFPWPSPLGICLSVSRFPSSYKGTSHWINIPPTPNPV